MSAVRQALHNLEIALSKLEGSVEQIESGLKGQQRDMFGAPVPGKPSAPPLPEKAHAEPMDTAIMAQKIDSAIDKVEALLRGAA